MASTNTKLVVVGFTLALLVASFSGATACERTGIPCDGSDAMCVPHCMGKGSAHCSLQHVVGDPSCVCGNDCDVQSTTATGDEPTVEKPATTTATPGRRGMGMLH